MPDVFHFYIRRSQADGILTTADALKLQAYPFHPCPITGKDLIQAGFSKTPDLGDLLKKARRIWALTENPKKHLVIQKLSAYNNEKGESK